MPVAWLLQLDDSPEAREDLLAASLALAISLFTAMRWATEVGLSERGGSGGRLGDEPRESSGSSEELPYSRLFSNGFYFVH